MTERDELDRALYAPMGEMRRIDEATLIARVDLIQNREPTLRVMRTADDYVAELDKRERERKSTRLDQQTTALIRLTWVLAALTAGLFVLELLRITGIVH